MTDRNLTGFLGLGDLTNEFDVEQAMLQRSTRHLDMVGKLKAALEGTGRDTLVKNLRLRRLGLSPAA